MPQEGQIEPTGDVKPRAASPSINWKDWMFLLLTGLLFAGNIASSNAEEIGRNIVIVLVWFLFFWSLSPFVRKAIFAWKAKQ
jgi:hypothetical protein